MCTVKILSFSILPVCISSNHKLIISSNYKLHKLLYNHHGQPSDNWCNRLWCIGLWHSILKWGTTPRISLNVMISDNPINWHYLWHSYSHCYYWLHLCGNSPHVTSYEKLKLKTIEISPDMVCMLKRCKKNAEIYILAEPCSTVNAI